MISIHLPNGDLLIKFITLKSPVMKINDQVATVQIVMHKQLGINNIINRYILQLTKFIMNFRFA